MSPSAEPTTTSQLLSDGIQHTLEATTSATDASSTTSSSAAHLPDLDASKLITTLTTAPRRVPEPNSPEVRSQKVCTDHMITCRWTSTNGWEAPELKEYGPLSLMPTASCLHYATECFEGMKIYRGYDGKGRLFRPELNCKRMLMSSARIALPGFEPSQLLKLIENLVATDAPKWLPKDRPGNFLYIRPTMIASDPTLGVQKPNEATLFIILVFFPSLDTPSGMRLLASKDNMIRAWPGGFGYAKVGANYGPTLVCQGEARARGFNQVLWLYGPDSLVTEAGGSNFFVVWKTKERVTQLVTAPLTDMIVLDGVVRRSILELLRERLPPQPDRSPSTAHQLQPLEIIERPFRMAEIVEAHREGRLIEAFTSGTAFFVCGTKDIEWRGELLSLPLDEDGCGPYANLVKGWLKGILYGKEAHAWGYIVEV